MQTLCSSRFMELMTLLIMVLVCMFGESGCHDPYYRYGGPPMSHQEAEDVGGNGRMVIDLPFAAGYDTLCTQGVNGSFSHQGNSTRYDLDFDTPNHDNDELYAPVFGRIYVHTDSRSDGFGYHVNIDNGDGTYVLVGHMEDVFVENGQEIAAGQLIGYEGCTGACSGDHIHIGLHQGDATLPAEYGTSIPVDYRMVDVTSGDSVVRTIPAEQVVCGTNGGGHVYRSDLGENRWHPSGSLVKTADSPDVYLVTSGVRQWIETEDVFWSMNYDFDDVALIGQSEFNCLTQGTSLRYMHEIDAVTDADGQVWMLHGRNQSAGRFRIRVQDRAMDAVMESWGLSYTRSNMPPGGTVADQAMLDYPAHVGLAEFRDGTLVREQTDPTVYFISRGIAMPIDTWDELLKLGYGSRPILWVQDGDVRAIHRSVGSCVSDFWCLNDTALETCFRDVGDPHVNHGQPVHAHNNDQTGLLFVDGFGYKELSLLWAPHNQVTQSEVRVHQTDASGTKLLSDHLTAVNYVSGEMAWRTDRFRPGDTIDFNVWYDAPDGTYAACQYVGQNMETHGWLDVWVDGILTSASLVDLAFVDGLGQTCGFRVTMGSNQTGPDPGDDTGGDGQSDCDDDGHTDDGGTDPGQNSDGTRTVCYVPGGTMHEGELYLIGPGVHLWSGNPADTAWSGDTAMCADLDLDPGDQLQVNGWFRTAPGGPQSWLAYNNQCQDIAFLGSVTVDGDAVQVWTEPWSQDAWDADPCSVGGDGYVLIP